jgi:hypothetical protein
MRKGFGRWPIPMISTSNHRDVDCHWDNFSSVALDWLSNLYKSMAIVIMLPLSTKKPMHHLVILCCWPPFGLITIWKSLTQNRAWGSFWDIAPGIPKVALFLSKTLLTKGIQ